VSLQAIPDVAKGGRWAALLNRSTPQRFLVVVVVLLVPLLPGAGVGAAGGTALLEPDGGVVVVVVDDGFDGSVVVELDEPDGSVVVVVELDEPGVTFVVPGVVDGGVDEAGRLVVVVVDDVDPEPPLPLLSQAARPRAKTVALASSQILLCISLSWC
jgi:hypothetical protein